MPPPLSALYAESKASLESLRAAEAKVREVRDAVEADARTAQVDLERSAAGTIATIVAKLERHARRCGAAAAAAVRDAHQAELTEAAEARDAAASSVPGLWGTALRGHPLLRARIGPAESAILDHVERIHVEETDHTVRRNGHSAHFEVPSLDALGDDDDDGRGLESLVRLQIREEVARDGEVRNPLLWLRVERTEEGDATVTASPIAFADGSSIAATVAADLQAGRFAASPPSFFTAFSESTQDVDVAQAIVEVWRDPIKFYDRAVQLDEEEEEEDDDDEDEDEDDDDDDAGPVRPGEAKRRRTSLGLSVPRQYVTPTDDDEDDDDDDDDESGSEDDYESESEASAAATAALLNSPVSSITLGSSGSGLLTSGSTQALPDFFALDGRGPVAFDD